MKPTWKRLLELPGRLSSLFSPTLREPSLILEELEVNGSGAAKFDSFYGYGINGRRQKRQRDRQTYLFTLLTDHDQELRINHAPWRCPEQDR